MPWRKVTGQFTRGQDTFIELECGHHLLMDRVEWPATGRQKCIRCESELGDKHLGRDTRIRSGRKQFFWRGEWRFY